MEFPITAPVGWLVNANFDGTQYWYAPASQAADTGRAIPAKSVFNAVMDKLVNAVPYAIAVLLD